MISILFSIIAATFSLASEYTFTTYGEKAQLKECGGTARIFEDKDTGLSRAYISANKQCSVVVINGAISEYNSAPALNGLIRYSFVFKADSKITFEVQSLNSSFVVEKSDSITFNLNF